MISNIHIAYTEKEWQEEMIGGREVMDFITTLRNV